MDYIGKKILILEDEIKIRFLLRDYFVKEGFITFEANNGLEGLQIFENNTIDLIVLDIMMPKMDGFQFLKIIREASTIPVILLTAKSEEDDKLEGYDLGADDYMTKPFSPKVLIAKIKALLKRSRENID